MPEDTRPSTYCLVANCNAVVGSCVTATEVNPPTVKDDAPNAMFVDPTVKELFTNAALAMFDNVLLDALIVLLVSVCAAVFVVTVSDTTWAEAMLKAPPVIVLLVNVNEDGNDKTGVCPPVDVISLAVPVTEVTAPISVGEIVILAAAVNWPCALTV